jgi:transposase-like protein
MEFTVLHRNEHRRRDVDVVFGRIFLNGVSTRKLKGLARKLFGKEVSAQAVSSTLACLDQELEKYRSRPLVDTMEFLFLDGISQKVREIGIEKKVELCALGIHRQEAGEEQPRKELLSFQLTEVEDAEVWRKLLGNNLQLIITDGTPGLLKALKGIYPYDHLAENLGRPQDHRSGNRHRDPLPAGSRRRDSTGASQPHFHHYGRAHQRHRGAGGDLQQLAQGLRPREA